MANAVRMEFLTARLDDIQNILKKHNIRAIPWKGPTLARDIYSYAALRPTDDLDFLPILFVNTGDQLANDRIRVQQIIG